MASLSEVFVEGKTLTRAERLVARCLPSLADIIFISVFVGALLGLQGRLLGLDGDAAWNLRIGTQILQHGLPRTEFMLSTTYGQPTLYYEWLAQVVYALALRIGGLNGVVALAAGFVALELTLLFVFLRRRGVPMALALALTLAAAFLTTSTWTARAQHFSLLLTLLWSEAIWRYWRTGSVRSLWFFPLSMVLWVNLHGGFIGGILLLGTATAVALLFPGGQAPRDQRSTRSPSEPFRGGRGAANPRHLGLALAGTLAATLLNPWGPALWPHIYSYLRNPLVLQNTKEFQSPDFHTVYALVFLALALALVAAWLWMARLRAAREQWAFSPLAFALAAVWTVLALQSVRVVALWALVVLPILGEALAACLRSAFTDEASAGSARRGWRRGVWQAALALVQRSRRMEALDNVVGRGAWAALALIAVLVVVLNGGTPPGTATQLLSAQWDASAFPVQAAQRLHISGLPSGRGFTTYTWGSYLDYALPEYHPFVDSRSDAYSQGLLQDYLDIIGLAPDWNVLLDRYDVRWALLPAGDLLTQALELRPEWQCHGADDQGQAMLCVRSR
jgi:hypothetical protein